MIPQFLAFRYLGIRRVDEIRAKPADLGWKCRKYMRLAGGTSIVVPMQGPLRFR